MTANGKKQEFSTAFTQVSSFRAGSIFTPKFVIMEFIYVDQWGNVDTGNTVGATELDNMTSVMFSLKLGKFRSNCPLMSIKH